MLFSGSVNHQNDKSINDQQIHQRLDHAYINHPPSMSWLKPSGNVTPQLATSHQPTDKIRGLVSTTSFSVLEVSSFFFKSDFCSFSGFFLFQNFHGKSMKSQVMRAVRILRVIKVLRLVGTVRMAEDRGKRGALFAERTSFGFTIKTG